MVEEWNMGDSIYHGRKIWMRGEAKKARTNGLHCNAMLDHDFCWMIQKVLLSRKLLVGKYPKITYSFKIKATNRRNLVAVVANDIIRSLIRHLKVVII